MHLNQRYNARQNHKKTKKIKKVLHKKQISRDKTSRKVSVLVREIPSSSENSALTDSDDEDEANHISRDAHPTTKSVEHERTLCPSPMKGKGKDKKKFIWKETTFQKDQANFQFTGNIYNV